MINGIFLHAINACSLFHCSFVHSIVALLLENVHVMHLNNYRSYKFDFCPIDEFGWGQSNNLALPFKWNYYRIEFIIHFLSTSSIPHYARSKTWDQFKWQMFLLFIHEMWTSSSPGTNSIWIEYFIRIYSISNIYKMWM